MQIIISSLVILRYVQLCHPNSRRFSHGIESCVVSSSAYLQKILMIIYIIALSVFEESQRYKSKFSKPKVWQNG